MPQMDIKTITLPGGTVLNFPGIQKGQPVYFVEGSKNDAEGVWTGTIPDLTEYYNGLTVIYLPHIELSTSQGATLNINNLGAYPCRFNNVAVSKYNYKTKAPTLFTFYNNVWVKNDLDTTYQSKDAQYRGIDVSLVTTGEKYTWGNKADKFKISDCNDSASTASKTVSISNYTRENGAFFGVYFTYANTADNPTLNVSDTDSYYIYVNGEKITTGDTKYLLKDTVLFVYYYNRYNLIGKYIDTTYESKAAASSGTDVSLVTTGEKYNWNNKANKVSNATNGHFAGLDSSGNLTDSGSSANDFLTDHQLIKQDGVFGTRISNTNTVSRFVTCTTASSTAEKTGDIKNGTFSLQQGAFVIVRFTNENTADNPTLNINSTGATSIYFKNSKISTGSNKSLLKGVVGFVYDGIQYNLIGNYIDTTYESKTAVSGGTDLSLVTTGEKYAWNNASGGADEAKVLILSATVSSLPTTISNSSITSDMVVLKSDFSDPSAQVGDLTVTTSDGSLTIAGTLSSSTTITLYLLRSR